MDLTYKHVTVKSYVRAECSEAAVTACLLEVSTMQGETYIFNVVPCRPAPNLSLFSPSLALALAFALYRTTLMCATRHGTTRHDT
jgi:hypothetical protein